MGIDINLFNFFHDLAGRGGLSDWLITFFASYSQYILGALFLVFLATKKFSISKWRVFWTGVAAIIVSRGIITTVIRYFYHRPRPFVAYDFTPLISENDFSFPSGHMTFFFALSTVIFMFNRRWGWFFYIVSAIMGIARIIAGVHYPSDIVGGVIIGIIFGYIVTRIIKKPCVP